MVELIRENNNHAQGRYGEVASNDGNRLHLEPNTDHYEVLVVTPTLAALHPSKHLTHALGNAQRTIEQWETLIRSHHANLRTSHANELRDSATLIINELPTTIEEDEHGMFAFAWIYIENGKNISSQSKTGTFYLPVEVTKLIKSGMELGAADDQVFKRENSKQEGGSVGILTHGVVDRKVYYSQAIILALIPFLNKNLFAGIECFY